MNKKIVVTMIGFVAIFTAACGNGESATKTEIGEPLVIERETTSTTSAPKVEEPTTTTTDSEASIDAHMESLCRDGVDQIMSGLPHISGGLSSLLYVDAATAREFLATANEFIDEAIELVDTCVSVTPEIASFRDSLYVVRGSLRDLSNSL